jgi:OOP family OmpA-OmpF porin
MRSAEEDGAMAQMRRWWPGLVAIAALWLIAVWLRTGPVELDLAGRTSAALQPVPLDKTRLAVRGRDVRLSGEAFSEEGQAQARAAARGVWGVRRLGDGLALVPEAKPFMWSAARQGDKIVLEGVSPLPATRDKLNAAVRQLGGAAGADQTAYARGARPRFEEMALLALAQLDKLTQGKVSIADGDVTVTGLAKDRAARDAIAAALQKLPDGFRVVENSVKAPPYLFSATRDAAGTLTLAGAVPDDATRQAILGAIKKSFFSGRVVDELKVAAGAPSGFAAAAAALLAQLARLDGGELKMSDGDVELKGSALYERAAEQIRTGIAANLPPGFQAKASLDVRPAGAGVDAAGCQQMFNQLLTSGRIYFQTGLANIDSASAGILDRLVAAGMRCPEVNFEVAGHTDSTGGDDINIDLSRRRAQAVTDYLTAAGLGATRMTAAGYGSTRPVASNETEEGRAQNRRIEFEVKP